MTTIKLEGIDFFSHHGFYEEERKVGNKYTVDIEVSFSDIDFATDALEKTVNYEDIYLIVSTIMSVPTKLLETLVSTINNELLKKFSMIDTVASTVSKHNPPIKGICKQASVTIKKSR